MIRSFADRGTEDLFNGLESSRTRRSPPDVQSLAFRRLDAIHHAHVLADLRVPPGNRLEALSGSLRGWHSVRINDQWRVVFQWFNGDATEVQIMDYHRWAMLPTHRVSTHPGEILAEDILAPLGKSGTELASHIGVPACDIDAVLRCERAVDADLAWRLSMALGTSPEFWLSLQSAYDLTRSRPAFHLPLLTAAS